MRDKHVEPTEPTELTPPLTDQQLRIKGPPRKLDNTLRTSFNDCPRKFYWEQRGYTHKITPPYFVWGEAWHEIKRTWYSSEGPWSPAGSDIWLQSARRALAAGQQHWLDSGAQSVGRNVYENLEKLWSLFLRSYPTETFRLVAGGSEQGWLWPLTTTGGQHTDYEYYLGGSIDGYIEWPGMGLFVLEEKTSGVYLNDNYIRGWSFSSQITQYAWFLTQFLNIDPEDGGVLVLMTFKVPLKASSASPQFARSFEKRTERQLREFERAALEDLLRIERAYELWHWPQTTNHVNCVGGIGRAPCLFQGLCLSGLDLEKADPLAFPLIGARDSLWAPWERGLLDESAESGSVITKDGVVAAKSDQKGAPVEPIEVPSRDQARESREQREQREQAEQADLRRHHEVLWRKFTDPQSDRRHEVLWRKF